MERAVAAKNLKKMAKAEIKDSTIYFGGKLQRNPSLKRTFEQRGDDEEEKDDADPSDYDFEDVVMGDNGEPEPVVVGSTKDEHGYTYITEGGNPQNGTIILGNLAAGLPPPTKQPIKVEKRRKLDLVDILMSSKPSQEMEERKMRLEERKLELQERREAGERDSQAAVHRLLLNMLQGGAMPLASPSTMTPAVTQSRASSSYVSSAKSDSSAKSNSSHIRPFVWDLEEQQHEEQEAQHNEEDERREALREHNMWMEEQRKEERAAAKKEKLKELSRRRVQEWHAAAAREKAQQLHLNEERLARTAEADAKYKMWKDNNEIDQSPNGSDSDFAPVVRKRAPTTAALGAAALEHEVITPLVGLVEQVFAPVAALMEQVIAPIAVALQDEEEEVMHAVAMEEAMRTAVEEAEMMRVTEEEAMRVAEEEEEEDVRFAAAEQEARKRATEEARARVAENARVRAAEKARVRVPAAAKGVVAARPTTARAAKAQAKMLQMRAQYPGVYDRHEE